MDRCSACPRTHRQVQGYGNPNARVMLIGEGPGKTENETGIPFSGQSGQELDCTYLPLAGLDRSDVWTTNVVQCRCERGGVDVKPGVELAKVCGENHLAEEIWNVSPEIIILLGSTACSLAGSINLISGIDLELQHGRAHRVDICTGLAGWSGTVVPMYHPAAGMRDGRYMIYSLEDWEKLGLWMRGKLQFADGTGIRTDYRLLRTSKQIEHTFKERDPAYIYLPIDTESDEGKVWSLQYSTGPGKGYMILAEDKQLIEDFDCILCFEMDSKAVMHNAMYDLDELDQLDVYVKDHRDTMQELYHLGNLPQGLKSAVYRAFGHRMVSYMETVVPHSRAKLNSWLNEAAIWAVDQSDIERHPVGPGCPSCGKKHRKDVSKLKPHEATAVLNRVLNAGPDYDPWQKPKLDHGEEKPRLTGRPWLADIEREIGRMPRQSIVHVPLDEAVQYGCSDADWTGRLGTWLEEERKRIVREEWKV